MWDRMSSQKGYKGPSHLAGGENCPYSFYSEKNKSVFNENTNFFFRKFFWSVFNENTDLFLFKKNFRSVFNENTDLFLLKKSFSD